MRQPTEEIIELTEPADTTPFPPFEAGQDLCLPETFHYLSTQWLSFSKKEELK